MGSWKQASPASFPFVCLLLVTHQIGATLATLSTIVHHLVPRSYDGTYPIRAPTACHMDEAQHKEVRWKLRKQGYLLPDVLNQRALTNNERHIYISGKATPRTKYVSGTAPFSLQIKPSPGLDPSDQ